MKTVSCPHSRLTFAQRQGQTAEEQALAYLRGQGLLLVARNVRFRVGEIDLIMREGQMILFIEVRFRQPSHFGGAALTVTASKQQRIRRAATLWLTQHYLVDRVPCRFDVVAMSPRQLDWIKDAF
jgi:putative endonuclease